MGASLDDRRDPAVRIVDYDPRWPDLFEREASAIQDALGDVAVRVDHVSSTAVPGLAAKPIIDINISVRDLEQIDKYRVPLEALGYLYGPHPESPDLHFFGKLADLKRALAEQHPGDRLVYMAGKEPMVLEIRLRALRWSNESG